MPEYAIAAVTADGKVVVNESEVELVDEGRFTQAVQTKQREAQRRRTLLTAGRIAPSVENKTAIIVDDGLTTGLTMLEQSRNCDGGSRSE
jgi:putative phosphoribosyl transferase